MADQSISELISATQIQDTDLFLLEQGGDAKSLAGRVLLNWLTAAADGHGGIQSITKLSTSGLVDTYRITLADTTTVDFAVTNGRGIQSIAKSGSSGLVDTYQVSYTDGSSSTISVTNGAKGDKGDNAYTWIKYASQQPTAASHSMGDIPDAWMGIYTGTLATAPTDWTQYKWYRVRGDPGATGAPATLTGRSVTYMASDSGTVVPSGSWSSEVPTVGQGRYLWTRVVLTFNSGSPITYYSVARTGVDGTGAVSTVNGQSPDSNGNVKLTAADIAGSSGQSVAEELDGRLPLEGGTLTGDIAMDGHTISGLADPASADQAARKGYVDGTAKWADHRNLLDNSNFLEPINQRGETTYKKGAWGGYTIDRWAAYVGGCTVEITDNGLTIKAGAIYQPIKPPASAWGKEITLAVRISGNVYLCSGITEKTGAWHEVAGVDIPNGKAWFEVEADGKIYVTIQSSGGDVLAEWAALYAGAYTADTLPEYLAKGYAAEMAECLRYFQVIKTGYPIRGIGYPTGSDKAWVSLVLASPMRAAPAVEIANGGTLGLVFAGTYKNAESQTFITNNAAAEPAIKAELTYPSGSFSAYGYALVPYTDNDIYISADL